MLDNWNERQQGTVAVLLTDYAAGTLDEAQTLLIDVWAGVSQDACKMVCEMEALGGALLLDCEPEPLRSTSLETVLCKLSDDLCDELKPPLETSSSSLPHPLGSYVCDEQLWHADADGIEIFSLDIPSSYNEARVMRMQAGAMQPPHTHNAMEIHVVLEGGFMDDQTAYSVGDLVIIDAKQSHAPIADKTAGCLCLSLICCDKP